MIDHFAYILGHGLLAFAMMRLVMREALDRDPLIDQLAAEAEEHRRAKSVAGRNAARRAQDNGAEQGAETNASAPAGHA
jgi:hypothetical protein